MLRLATDSIDLASLSIDGMAARRAATGAQIFEGGPDNKLKADAFAEKIREVVAGKEGVQITRPSPTAEIRVRDLCDAADEEDMRKAIANADKCDPTLVKVWPIKVASRGMGTAWARCPLAVANQLVASRRMRVGWTNVRIEALETRPLQCFKCLGKGHVRAQCKSDADRASLCYRCGEPSHIARDCEAPAKCSVCADLGRPAQHRAGSHTCNAPRKGKRGIENPPSKQTLSEGGSQGRHLHSLSASRGSYGVRPPTTEGAQGEDGRQARCTVSSLYYGGGGCPDGGGRGGAVQSELNGCAAPSSQPRPPGATPIFA